MCNLEFIDKTIVDNDNIFNAIEFVKKQLNYLSYKNNYNIINIETGTYIENNKTLLVFLVSSDNYNAQKDLHNMMLECYSKFGGSKSIVV